MDAYLVALLVPGILFLVLYAFIIIYYFRLTGDIKEMRDMMVDAHYRRVTGTGKPYAEPVTTHKNPF